MKKILLMIVFAFTFITFAQTNIPVVTDSTYFYASATSETINLKKNEFIAQIWLDADRSLSVWPQFYDDSKEQWSWVLDNGAKLVYTTPDVTLDWVIPLEPRRFYVGKTIRFIIVGAPADTLSMRYDKRPY